MDSNLMKLQSTKLFKNILQKMLFLIKSITLTNIKYDQVT